MSAGVEFPAGAVLRHADAVGGASDEMARARAAAADVAMDGEAYGRLCQFLPALLAPVFEGATRVMNEATEALGETVLNLRAVAAEMTATDEGSAQQLKAAAGAGPDLPL